MPLTIHFLNVGHGDCTFVELPSGRLMMVDINNSKSLGDEVELAADLNLSLTQFRYSAASMLQKSWEQYYRDKLVDPAEYYLEKLAPTYGAAGVFRYIQTHPDMDHLSGLHRFFWQERVPLQNFWDVAHTKTKEESDFEGTRHSYLDWLAYRLLSQGIGPDSPDVETKSHTVGNRHRHWTGQFWTDDNIEILSPTPELVTACNTKGNWNDASYVFRISYGGRSVVLAGDTEAAAWESMLEDASHKMSCDILKAAHHGRMSGHHVEALQVMDPEYVICSVGNKQSVPDASPRYRDQGATVFSTRARGTITAKLWHDGEVWITDSDGNRIGELPVLVGAGR